MEWLTVILMGFAAAGQPTLADNTCSVLTDGEAQVLAETNEARAKAGQPPLVVDCRLMGAARRHARQMARTTTLVHSSGLSVAENIAAGQPNAREVVVVWLNSPSHRANMLSRRYSRIGMAGFIGPDGKAYWVQQFAP